MITLDQDGEGRAALLTFPECDDAPWEDSGEGGQYVMLVVPEPLDHNDNCSVDVTTFLRLPKPANRVDTVLTYPDVCHTPNELWERQGYLDGFRESGDAYRHFTELHDERLARWAIRITNQGELSCPALASVLLGSDGQSRWSNQHGAYWVAGKDDLTFRGKLLLDILRNLYQTEPLLLTFLDT